MINTILTPLDGSRQSLAALDFACGLARHHGARLILLHVQYRTEFGAQAMRAAELDALLQTDSAEPSTLESLPTEVRRMLAGNEQGRSAQQALEFLVQRVITPGRDGVRRYEIESASLLLREGDPAKRIVGAAEEVIADLIVMGTRGMSDLQGLLFGSVSNKVAALAHCPVTLVK